MSTAGEEGTLRKGFGDLRLLEFLKCEMKGEKQVPRYGIFRVIPAAGSFCQNPNA